MPSDQGVPGRSGRAHDVAWTRNDGAAFGELLALCRSFLPYVGSGTFATRQPADFRGGGGAVAVVAGRRGSQAHGLEAVYRCLMSIADAEELAGEKPSPPNYDK